MRTTGSKKGDAVELYGVIALASPHPSFGLPIFRSGTDDYLGQVVDEITGRISRFDRVRTEGEKIIPVARRSRFKIGDKPALCIIIDEEMAEGGSKDSLQEQLESVIYNSSNSLAVRLQAAGIVDPAEERRLRKSISWYPANVALTSIRAYNRSLGRSVLWEKLVRGARNEDVADRTLRLRPQLDVDVNDDGSIRLHLSSLSAPDYPNINFENLAAEIEGELESFIPSNDDKEADTQAEGLFSINSENLKIFLDRKLGTDARIRNYTYRWSVDLLRALGFLNLNQLDDAISGYSARQLSYVATGNLQGQTTKLDLMLLAAMGEIFIARHVWKDRPWFSHRERRIMDEYRKHGISIKGYDPRHHVDHLS